MPTPNFNLPLINGASPIAIVNDMNALATAVDAAMATLVTATQLAAVKTTADSASKTAAQALTAANAADGKATTAATNATTAVNTANTAATNATTAVNTANATANTAAQNATGAIASIESISAAVPNNKISTQSFGQAVEIDLNLWVSNDKKHFAFSGYFTANAAITNYSAIPGGSNMYGLKATNTAPFSNTDLTEVKMFKVNGIQLSDSDFALETVHLHGTVLAIGTDGNLYLSAATGTGVFAWPDHMQYFPYAEYRFDNAD